MFFVISGYCSPDRYIKGDDDAPVLEFAEYSTAEEVEEARREFFEMFDEDDEDDEASSITFRVIEGVERKFVPVEKVTK